MSALLVADAVVKRRFRRGEIVVEHGKKSNALFIMLTGRARVLTAVIFALTALGSIAIYLWLPFAAWSLWANVVSPVLVGVLFVGEHLLRHRIHPEFQRTRMIDAVRAFYGVSSVAEPPAKS